MNAKKVILLLILLTFIFSCKKANQKNEANDRNENSVEKTAFEFEDESIKKGGSSDTTLLGFVFGMKKDQVANKCKKLKSKNVIGNLTDGNVYYAIETKSFKIGLRIEFYYDNEGKLFRITEQPIPNLIEKKEKGNKTNVLDEILRNYKNDLGKNPLINGTQSNAKFYWLKGDKRFDYLEEDNTCVLAMTKISAERKMMKFNQEFERKKIEEENLKEREKVNKQRLDEEIIIAKLKVKAKRDWPDDYSTQEFWINEQIEAYHYMLTIPNNRIKKKAQRDWPLDFLTQQFWYNEQIEAKERL